MPRNSWIGMHANAYFRVIKRRNRDQAAGTISCKGQRGFTSKA